MSNSEKLKKMLLIRLGGVEVKTVFSDDELDTFMTLALARLNRTGRFTSWTLDEELVIKYFPDVIVGWAASMAWMSKAAPEAGREMAVSVAETTVQAGSVAQKLLDLARIEGDTFRLSYDKISDTKKELVPSSTKWN